MTYDFSHAAMHVLADWPILARIAARQTTATDVPSIRRPAARGMSPEGDRKRTEHLSAKLPIRCGCGVFNTISPLTEVRCARIEEPEAHSR